MQSYTSPKRQRGRDHALSPQLPRWRFGLVYSAAHQPFRSVARPAPAPTNSAPDTRFVQAAKRGRVAHRAACPASRPYPSRTKNSVTIEVAPRINTCQPTEPAGSMNSGRIAVKNNRFLGFAACSAKPAARIRRPLPEGRAHAADRQGGSAPEERLHSKIDEICRAQPLDGEKQIVRGQQDRAQTCGREEEVEGVGGKDSGVGPNALRRPARQAVGQHEQHRRARHQAQRPFGDEEQAPAFEGHRAGRRGESSLGSQFSSAETFLPRRHVSRAYVRLFDATALNRAETRPRTKPESSCRAILPGPGRAARTRRRIA